MSELIELIGIGDAHGIDALGPVDALQTTLLSVRAHSNRHRHAVLFKAGLTQEHVDHIEALLRKGELIEALSFIKSIPDGGCDLSIEKGRERSWSLIPDPRLDPYHKGDTDA